MDNYIKRLAALEQISNSVEGVERSYAIQAGREIRVIVEPDKVDDKMTFKIAREIREQIEANLQYPGTIKVTVVRETRATDVAK
jgi:ribonuclease Y